MGNAEPPEKEPLLDASGADVAIWVVGILVILFVLWGWAELTSGDDQGSADVHCTQDIGFMGQQEVYCEPVRYEREPEPFCDSWGCVGG